MQNLVNTGFLELEGYQVLGIQFHQEKPGLFNPSTEHPKACGSTINFKETIANSESYDFHKAYWKQLGMFLQNKRDIR